MNSKISGTYQPKTKLNQSNHDRTEIISAVCPNYNITFKLFQHVWEACVIMRYG